MFKEEHFVNVEKAGIVRRALVLEQKFVRVFTRD